MLTGQTDNLRIARPRRKGVVLGAASLYVAECRSEGRSHGVHGDRAPA